MSKKIILDTGPLVAYLKNQDQFHHWARTIWTTLDVPFLTCESVISEACFLLKTTYGGKETLLSLLKDGIIEINFSFKEHLENVGQLMKRYESIPMSFADACLVRMSELNDGSSIFTLDSDFVIYRQNKNQLISLIIADEIVNQ